jgi:hypothetical protein
MAGKVYKKLRLKDRGLAGNGMQKALVRDRGIGREQ